MQGHGVVAAYTPIGKDAVQCVRLGFDGVSQRLKKFTKKYFAPAAWKGRNRGSQRKWLFGQCWPFLASATQRRSEYLGDGDAQKAGGDVRAVVDVLFEGTAFARGSVTIADQRHRINIQ